MFPYLGGKAKQTWWIDEMFPRHMSNNFDKFVEVFGGAGWIGIKSNRVCNMSSHVYNDYNPYIANIYHCFVFKRQQLYTAMSQYPHSNTALWYQFRDEIFPLGQINAMGNVDLAAKYLYLQTQSFIGNTLSERSKHQFINETEGDGGRKSRYEMVRDRLMDSEFTTRLDGITHVENKDCIQLIKDHDSPRTFFYLDPPYYSKEFYYSKDFPQVKHQELADVLAGIQGKFALSYYDFPNLYRFYPQNRYRWYRQLVNNETAHATGNKTDSEEILIMNYGENDYNVIHVYPSKIRDPDPKKKPPVYIDLSTIV